MEGLSGVTRVIFALNVQLLCCRRFSLKMTYEKILKLFTCMNAELLMQLNPQSGYPGRTQGSKVLKEVILFSRKPTQSKMKKTQLG